MRGSRCSMRSTLVTPMHSARVEVRLGCWKSWVSLLKPSEYLRNIRSTLLAKPQMYSPTLWELRMNTGSSNKWMGCQHFILRLSSFGGIRDYVFSVVMKYVSARLSLSRQSDVSQRNWTSLPQRAYLVSIRGLLTLRDGELQLPFYRNLEGYQQSESNFRWTEAKQIEQ